MYHQKDINDIEPETIENGVTTTTLSPITIQLFYEECGECAASVNTYPSVVSLFNCYEGSELRFLQQAISLQFTNSPISGMIRWEIDFIRSDNRLVNRPTKMIIEFVNHPNASVFLLHMLLTHYSTAVYVLYRGETVKPDAFPYQVLLDAATTFDNAEVPVCLTSRTAMTYMAQRMLLSSMRAIDEFTVPGEIPHSTDFSASYTLDDILYYIRLNLLPAIKRIRQIGSQ